MELYVPPRLVLSFLPARETYLIDTFNCCRDAVIYIVVPLMLNDTLNFRKSVSRACSGAADKSRV